MVMNIGISTIRLSALATLTTFAATQCAADTLHVPDEYATIQAAINDAEDGDVVIVAAGVYMWNDQRNINFHGKKIVLRSADRDPATCIIDFEGSPYRAFLFEEGEDYDTIINGFTFRNAHQPGGAGVIYARYGASPLFRNCVFANNHADDNTGVVFAQTGSIRFERCMFVGNSTDGGGGVASLHNADAVFDSCIFSGNAAVGRSGAVYAQGAGAQPLFVGCTFYGNTSEASGGAIYSHSTSAVIRNCIVRNNSAVEIDWDPNGSPPAVEYSNVQGYSSTAGNIDADPMFVDPDGADNTLGTPDDDFRLREGSPCIDAGTGLALEVERDADMWKRNALHWEGYAFDAFFPGIANGTGNLAESGITLQLERGTVTLRHLDDSGFGDEQPYALKDGSTGAGQVSDGDLSSIDGTMVMEFDPPVTAFYSYYGSLYTNTDGFIRMWSNGRIVDEFFGPISIHSTLAFGHGFTSLMQIDRVDFASWDNYAGGSLMGAFAGVYPGDTVLGTVNIPGYDGPNGETVDLDFGVTFVTDKLPQDAAGNLRAADGDGDGTPFPDMGAFEFDPDDEEEGARLKKFKVRKGERLGGKTRKLRKSDDRSVILRSERVHDAHIMNMEIAFQTDASNPQSMEVTVESRIDESGGMTTLLARNWDQGRWEEIGRVEAGTSESSGSVRSNAAQRYIRPDGTMKIRVKQVVDGRDSSFRSWIDHVGVTLR